jgi:predicted permease
VAYAVNHPLRALLRDRAFTLVAVLSIGLGAGANSAIFSLVDQALLRRLPVREPERLVLLNWNGAFIGYGWGSGNLLPYPVYRDLRAEPRLFDGVFGRHPTTVYLSLEDTPEPASAEIVTGSYFSVLGVRPALGRLIGESDDVQPGAHPVVVLSFDYWRNRLGGAGDVVGRKVLVNTHPMTVIGVAAAGFHGMDWGEVPSLWIPTMMKRQATPDFDWLEDRRGRWLHVFARLKPGMTSQEAQAGLQPWFKAMLEEDTKREGWPRVTEEQRRRFLASTLELLPASQGRSDLRGRLERPLLVLLAATALVLLLACLNVANLCLARAFARRKETALRLALGATRGRIAKEQLLQSGILALGGGALGVFLAPTVTQTLISLLPQEIAAVDLSSVVHPRVFLFTLAVALLTGLLFGLAPALQAGRAQPASVLKEESSTVAGGVGLRKALVVGQIAFALVLLIGAGLFVRTLASLRAQGPGFITTNLLSFGVNPGRSGHTQEQSKSLVRDLLAAVRNLPEVESAASSGAHLLMGGSWNSRLTVEAAGRVVTDGVVYLEGISSGYFQTLGVPLISGRDFDDRDPQGAPEQGFRAAIVNESFARHYFGDRSPVGARLGLGSLPDTPVDIEIVGVVRTFSYRGLRGSDDQAFLPSASRSGFYVRTRVPSRSAFSAIRAAVRGVDPTIPIEGLRTLDDQLDRTLVNERLLAILASTFAALAMALPAVWALGRLIENQLFGVRAMDGATIGAAAAIVVLVALGAVALPARRASSVSPVEALRCE